MVSKYTARRMLRNDGWGNILSGQGKRGYDKTESIHFSNTTYLCDDELTAIYSSGGVGSKIIEQPSDDTTRRWYELENDDEAKVFEEQTRIKLQQATKEAIIWARLYGGAVIVMDVDDGQDMIESLDINRVKRIKSLKVYDRTRVNLSYENFNRDPNSDNNGEPEIFNINKLNGVPFDIHASRCLIFKGRKAPANKTFSNSLDDYYWGFNVLQHMYDALKNHGSTEKSIATVMQEFVISVYKLKNLSNIVGSSDDDAKEFYDRMDIIQASKSILNGIFMDADMEDFSRNTANIGGAAEIIDRFQMTLSAVSRIPVSLLFGTSPAGLNANGDFSLRTYYDSIASYQNNELSFVLQPCLDIISQYENGGKTVKIVWLSLYEPTEKEVADVRKIVSEVDKAYIDMGVLSPEQVFGMRWKNGVYTTEMTLEDEEYNEPTEDNTGNLDTKNDSTKKKKIFRDRFFKR